MASTSTSTATSHTHDPTSSYTPTYIPIQPHRHLNISATLSTRKAHFRRLYDIYHISLQRNNILQAKRAYALLVRCREFDWAANWRSGLEMVQLPDHEQQQQQDPQKRLLQLKVDFLRECHIVHSRVARKKHSLREPDAILLQLVILLATNKRHTEALNELELYLPVAPYRDNALLHYYAGLLCIYTAQVDLVQDETLTTALSFGSSWIQSGNMAADSQNAQSHTHKKRRHPSGSSSSSSSPSSSSSSSSDSSTSSSDEAPMTTSKSNPAYTQPSSHIQPPKSGQSYKDLRYSRIKPSLHFTRPPSVELVSKITAHSPSLMMDARKWFELAKKIAKEQGGRAFDDCDNWLGLLDGLSVEESRKRRKSAFIAAGNLNNLEAEPQRRVHSALRSSMYKGRAVHTTPPSHPSSSTPRSTVKSILKGKGRARDDFDAGSVTSTGTSALLTAQNTRMDARNGGDHAGLDEDGVNDDDDSDDDDDDDPFKRYKAKERQKRKRQEDRMVSFAEVGFDLDA